MRLDQTPISRHLLLQLTIIKKEMETRGKNHNNTRRNSRNNELTFVRKLPTNGMARVILWRAGEAGRMLDGEVIWIIFSNNQKMAARLPHLKKASSLIMETTFGGVQRST